ncbi:MAG: DNA polymerase III subunit delta [Burkholderiaceae bacterium]|nr:DNA polymerase III subunit delta [Burkholderiaceae bacterium]
MFTCVLCGNPRVIMGVCPHCGTDALPLKESDTVTVNLELGGPTTEEALNALTEHIRTASEIDIRTIIVIHGYGSSGIGGSIRRTIREALANNFFADRVEGNLLAAHQEIRKLSLLYPDGRLSLDQIQDAVLNVARYDVFKLSEAMLAGDVSRVTRMLDGLKGEGEALPLVLWAISEEIRTLLKLKMGSDDGRPLAAMLKEYRIWGPRERLMAPAVSRVRIASLRDALNKAAQVDRMIKGLRAKDFAGDAWDALLQLALVVARK